MKADTMTEIDQPLTPEMLEKMDADWGATLGQNFIYAHLNRGIKKYDPPPEMGGEIITCPGVRRERVRNEWKAISNL